MSRQPAPVRSGWEEPSRGAVAGALILLVAATLAAYWPVLSHDFLVEWDDPDYVTANLHVQQGLTAQGVAWAFRTTEFANWFPLTWLSHMLDCQLFRLHPMGHHLTSLVLHVLNSLLLYGVLRRLTGAAWRSCVVAGLFALHPLHVESVAWVAERKDVLSTFFGMLTLWAYARYVTASGWPVTNQRATDERQTPRTNATTWFVIALVFFGLSLMAKAMLVSLPLILLLLDYWPLRRTRTFDGLPEAGGASPTRSSERGLSFGRLFWEKGPFFALSAASSIVTFLAQRKGGTLAALSAVPLSARLANVPVAYASYLAKTFFLAGLSPLYPFAFHLPAWRVAGSVALLVLASAAALRDGRRLPYLLTGWFWYVLTLLPVIGLVQVGGAAMADRYTYVPLIGIFIIVAWGSADLISGLDARWRNTSRLAVGTAAAILIVCLAMATRIYVGYWQNSFTLFSRALEVDEANDTAHFNVGLWLATREGKLREAAEHFRRAVSLNPRHAPSRYSLGLCLERLGDPVQAAHFYREALAVDPAYGPAHHNLAILLEQDGRREEAIAHYEAALDAAPHDVIIRQNLANAHNNFGAALDQQGKVGEAEAQFRAATRVSSTNALAEANLALTLYQQGRYAEAWQAVDACRRDGGSLSASLMTNLAEHMARPNRPAP